MLMRFDDVVRDAFVVHEWPHHPEALQGIVTSCQFVADFVWSENKAGIKQNQHQAPPGTNSGAIQWTIYEIGLARRSLVCVQLNEMGLFIQICTTLVKNEP